MLHHIFIQHQIHLQCAGDLVMFSLLPLSVAQYATTKEFFMCFQKDLFGVLEENLKRNNYCRTLNKNVLLEDKARVSRMATWRVNKFYRLTGKCHLYFLTFGCSVRRSRCCYICLHISSLWCPLWERCCKIFSAHSIEGYFGLRHLNGTFWKSHRFRHICVNLWCKLSTTELIDNKQFRSTNTFSHTQDSLNQPLATKLHFFEFRFNAHHNNITNWHFVINSQCLVKVGDIFMFSSLFQRDFWDKSSPASNESATN